MQAPDTNELNEKNALSIFMACQYDLTGSENDFEFLDDIKDNFNEFCTQYRIRTSGITTEDLQKGYQLPLITKNKQKLVMKKDNISQKQSQEQQKGSFVARLTSCYTTLEEPKKYIVDKNSLELHVQLTSNPVQYGVLHLQQLTKAQLLKREIRNLIELFSPMVFKHANRFSSEERIFLESIYYKKWFIVDAYIVLMHFCINAVVICPVILSIIFHQVSFAPYSLSHPSNQFSTSDFRFSIV